MGKPKILVIQLRQLGDILLTTPCLRAIKAERPEAHVSFLCHPMGAKVLGLSPYIDDLITYREGLAPAPALLRRLHQERFDLVLDFMNNPRSALYSWMSRAPQRFAFHSRRSLAYTHTCPRATTPTYIVREKFSLLSAAGFTPNCGERLDLPWASEDELGVRNFIELHPALQAAPLRIVLSPTHRRSVRKWPAARYCALAALLVEKWQAAVTWVWGPGEEEEVTQLQALCSVPTFKAPAMSLRQLTAFMASQDLFIGNSNGPSHLAVAAGICSLQLHGHTAAAAWSPLTDQHRAIQSPEFGQTPLPSLDPISLDMVWKVLMEFLPTIRSQAAHRLRITT